MFGSFGGARAGAQFSGPCRGELDPLSAPDRVRLPANLVLIARLGQAMRARAVPLPA
jgi:hypothetical protein